MKKILLINGHPDPENFGGALSEAYRAGVATAGAPLEIINIRELDFDPNLRFGYRQRTELEPDLLQAQELIRWADHLVCDTRYGCTPCGGGRCPR